MTKTMRRLYSPWFLVPVGIIFFVLFILPTLMSFFFSMTTWTLTEWRFTGFDNLRMFFNEVSLSISFRNSIIYSILTCAFKVVLGLLFGAVLSSSMLKTRHILRSVLFFPNLISTLAVGLTFKSLMHPTRGLINSALAMLGIAGPDWLGNVSIALYSIIGIDVWKGVGIATVIYISGIMSIPEQYYEALSIDGGNTWDKFLHITLPLSRPARNSVIILAFIGGLRTFDLVWATTKGGPGFYTDLLASVVYKQYSAGFYGLATLGNVLMLLLICALAFPLYFYITRKEVDL
ncbi:MAG: sugar ABC transporter permease [Clostridia bacterium]|nr:sugar ABC transporter permease [Clostridia bacterium]